MKWIFVAFFVVIGAVGALAQVVGGNIFINVLGENGLAPGTYNITNGGLNVDCSFSTGAAPYVRLNTPNANALAQQWLWNGKTFKCLTTTLGNAAGAYMADAGNATVTMTATGDNWTTGVVGGRNTGTVKDLATTNFLINSSGSLAMTSTSVQTITSVLLNGGTTASFTVSATAYVPLGPVTATCSGGPCTGITTTLATSGDGCTTTNGAGNPNFIMTSADGTTTLGGQSVPIYAAEGVWTFDGLTADGVDYNLLLNGSTGAANAGQGSTMKIVNGTLYALYTSTGHWYSRHTGGWTDTGTTAPVESATQTPQTLVANSNVAAGTYPVCALDTSASYSNSPQGVALTITANPIVTACTGLLSGSICPAGSTIAYTISFQQNFTSMAALGSNWTFVLNGYPWGNWAYNDGGPNPRGVSFPGDGSMLMNGFDASGISGNPGYPGGETLLTTFNMAAPGYYEFNATPGSAWNGWFTIGNYTCPTPAQPGEMDFVEVVHGAGHIDTAWSDGDGGSTCGQTIDHGSVSFDITTTHVWGADVSTSRGLTLYEDGAKLSNIPYPGPGSIGLCLNASSCGKQLSIQAGGSTSTCSPPSCTAAPTTTPLKIYWFRYYTESPQ